MSVEEIQDDNGPTDNGVVDADVTFAKLIGAIQAAGGPTYDFRQINPVNDQDGGEPGGNIRVGFLFRTDRGLAFIDRPGGTSTAATTVVGSGAATQLSFSPGRIDPTNSAFSTSRKPLAAEFSFNGHHLFAIANHYTYDFEGNSQTLDHILLSDALFGQPLSYDAVHVNSEFATQASDHDPQVVRIALKQPYDFSGFFQPVDNLPVVNSVSAGRAVPVNFSLNGDKGLGIFAPGYPKSEQTTCDSTDPVDGIETTVSANSSGLQYDPATDTYTYVWKTDKAWAKTCRQLVLKLDGGTFHRASFLFTR